MRLPARSIAVSFFVPLGAVAMLFSLLIIYQVHAVSRDHTTELMNQQAELALEFNLAIRQYAAEVIRPAMEAKSSKDSFDAPTMSTSYISRAVFDKVRRKCPQYVVRFASDNPRNPINAATEDERKMLEYFRAHPSLVRETREVTIEGRRYLAHFAPKRMVASCMRCHSDPKNAPSQLVAQYGPTRSFHRTVGEVAGLDVVAVPLDTIQEALASQIGHQCLMLAGGLTVLFGAIFLLFRLVVTRRLQALTRHFEEIARCPDSPSMRPVIVRGRDEIAQAAVSFNKLLSQVREMQAALETRVSQRTEELSQANKALRDEIEVRTKAEEELRFTARLDRLTGLPNRALLLDRLDQAVYRARRVPNYRFALLFVDLDRFKRVNDSLGHQLGDVLLTEAARRLRDEVRAVDTVSRQSGSTASRFGGDEFVLLLDGIVSSEAAISAAERILRVLEAPYSLPQNEVVCSASIGIVIGDANSSAAEEIIRDADTAMYEAKQLGGNRAVVFDASMHARIQTRLTVENDLRKALEGDQFLLHYQPIVSLVSGRVEGMECLVRWKHPERGMVPPMEFIPAAEESGLILPLGEWVFRQACRQWVRWREIIEPAALPRLSINLSRRQLTLRDLPLRLRDILEQTGADARYLNLEITESAVMQDAVTAAAVLRELKEMGFHIDLDDFGTGYSSLASLHQFPIDTLKIDRSFINNLEKGTEFVQFATGIILLAASYHLEVIAEGVETSLQMSMLQSLNCSLAQGYFFAKPMPADQAVDFFRHYIIPVTDIDQPVGAVF